MKIKNILLTNTLLILILSQTVLAKIVLFFAIPLVFLLKINILNKYALKTILFLNILIITGFISGLIHIVKYDYYFFFRDIMYFLQVPFFILIGMYLYSNIKNYLLLLQVIVLSSISVTIFKLFNLFLDPSLFLKLGLVTRYEYDLSNPTALLVFAIILYARKIGYKIFNNYIELLFLYLSLFSIIISFSRTSYVFLLITLIVPFIYRGKKIILLFFSSIIMVLFIIFGGLISNENTTYSQGNTFQSKVIHSLDEMVIKNYTSTMEISHNWRGYEAYLGLTKYYTGNLLEILFGHGYGSVVYTPYWVFQGQQLNVLPFFHNGYITILLKTGLFGLLAFFIFLFTLLKTGMKITKLATNNEQKLIGMLLEVSVFIIIFRTIVIHGIFFTTTPLLLLILIGISIQFSSLQISHSKRKLSNEK